MNERVKLWVCPVILVLATFAPAIAQHTVAFTISPTACKNETLAVENLSEAGSTLEWNFCASELDGNYGSTVNRSISTFLTAIEIVEDNGNWFGFAASRSNELFRLDFGAFPFNPDYVLTSLGNPSSLLNSPDGIGIVKDGSAWYGLITNLNNNELIRLKWTSLSAPPTAISLSLAGTGKLNQPSQVEIHKDNNEFIAIVANGGSNKLAMVNFHGSMENIPAAPDVIESIAFPAAASMYGVSATRQCDGWEIYSIATDKIYRVTATSLFSPISAGQIHEFSNAFSFPIGSFNRVRTLKYFDRTYIYFTSFTGGYIKGVSWQSGASAPEMVDLSGVTAPALPFSLAIVKNGNNYGMYTGGFNTGSLRAIQMTSACNVTRKTPSEFNPRDISYSGAGTYRVGLNITYADGQTCSMTKQVVVSVNDAPPVDFTFDNICKNSTTSFVLQPSQSLPVTWDYGDGNSNSTGTHVYSTAGTYEVAAEVTAPNTCKNRKYKNISVYDPPVAGFDAPTGPVCTNNEFTFDNTTPDIYGGNLSYSWTVNGVAVSTARNLVHAFVDEGDNEVELITSIPGCSDNESFVLNDMPKGPIAQFTVVGKCSDETVAFNNTSSGDITGYLWTFEGGNSTTDISPQRIFDPGTYDVTLSATATNGCVTNKVVPVPIYTKPDPSFSLDLPPFSCTGTPSQFHDTSGSMSDSNIQLWDWTFGDGANGTGKNPTHVYTTAGQYSVELTATTDKGCFESTTQQVTITQSPEASFNIGASCVNKATQLTDASTGNVVGWQWKIGNAVYTSEDTQHIFSVPGNYAVQLTVTGQNSCTNTLIEQATVPVVPVVDFMATDLCAGQPAMFTDITASATDPVTQQNWTFDDLGNATGTVAGFAFATAGSYTTQLQVTTQSGCMYSISKGVNINSSPVASFTMSDQSGPPPLHVFFTSTSAGAASQVWNFQDGTQSTETSTDHTFTDIGDHVVNLAVTNTDGCSTTETKTITVVDPENELALTEFDWVQQNGNAYWQVYVRVKNNGNYSIDGFGVTYDIGGTMSFRKHVVGSLGVGEEKVFILDNQFTNQAEGSYICVELDNDKNPEDNRACNLFSGSTRIFNVSPNPPNDHLTIESITANDNLHVRIYNMSGGVAYDRSFSVQGYSRLTLDIQNLSPGLYVIVMSTANSTSSQKILIAR